MGLEIKISIIVPVYKVEHELDRCVKSLLGQTYKNIEIIRYDTLKLDNKFNIILLSRFLECKDAIIKLNEYLNSKECV